jgi:hypothetical protein
MGKGDNFEMDPAAQSATLDVKDAPWRHHVEWAASNDDLNLYQSESSCKAGKGYGAGVVRPAATDARVYGHRFQGKPTFASWNELWTGAHVTQCDLLAERDLRDLMDGGGFTIHRTYTIR